MEIDELAEETDRSRSAMVRQIVAAGLERLAAQRGMPPALTQRPRPLA